jgi:hypothetical protein
LKVRTISLATAQGTEHVEAKRLLAVTINKQLVPELASMSSFFRYPGLVGELIEDHPGHVLQSTHWPSWQT